MFLKVNHVFIELFGVNLINGDLVHFFKVRPYFFWEPVIDTDKLSEHLVLIFVFSVGHILKISILESLIKVNIVLILVPELIDFLIAQSHGGLDSWHELGHDGELFQPEGRVGILRRVLSIPGPSTDHIVPLLERIHVNVDIVPPVLNAPLDRALLEETHQNVSQLGLLRCDPNQLFAVAKLAVSVAVPVVQIEVRKGLFVLFIHLNHLLLNVFLGIKVKHYLKNRLKLTSPHLRRLGKWFLLHFLLLAFLLNFLFLVCLGVFKLSHYFYVIFPIIFELDKIKYIINILYVTFTKRLYHHEFKKIWNPYNANKFMAHHCSVSIVHVLWKAKSIFLFGIFLFNLLFQCC